MAESNLEGNKKSPNEDIYFKGLVGSIARRVITVCITFLVIPLIFHSFFMYQDEYKQAFRTIIGNLNTITRAEDKILMHLFNETLADLRTLGILIPFPASKEDRNKGDFSSWNAILAKIAVEHNFTALFYSAPNGQNELEVILAANPERLGKKNKSPQYLVKVKEFGYLISIQKDTVKEAQEVFLDVAITDPSTGQIKGVLTCGIGAQDLVDRLVKFQGIQYPLIIAFSSMSDEVLISNTPLLLENPQVVFNLEDLAELSNDKGGSYPQMIEKLPSNGNVCVKIPMVNNSLYLVVGMPKVALYGQITQDLSSHLLRLTILFTLLGGAAVFFLVTRISRPLKNLAFAMQKVSKGDLATRYTPDVMGFEINRLGHDFNLMVESLINHMKEANVQKLAKEVLQKELDIGRQIQKAILPRKLPHFDDFEIATAFLPAKEVAGDFFDVFQRSDQKIVLSVADASGKGVSACLYSLCIRSILRSFEFSLYSLEEIILKANQLFVQDTGKTGTFVTVWIGIIDPATKILEYSSCGHLPALLKKANGELIEITTPGIALGVVENIEVQVKKLQLQSGDVLISYTDGVIEAFNKDGDSFSLKRLKDSLKNYKDQNINAYVKSILQEVEEFTSSKEFQDDLTILGIKIHSKQTKD